jgi:hypothetical protein
VFFSYLIHIPHVIEIFRSYALLLGQVADTIGIDSEHSIDVYILLCYLFIKYFTMLPQYSEQAIL